MLPTILMVSAGFNRFVVFTCVHVNTKNVKLKTVIHPAAQLSGVLEGDGTVINTGEYINERVGGDKTYYKLVVKKLNRWLKVGSEKIYEYIVEQPCLSLPIEFYSVYKGKDSTENWHLLVSLPVAVATPVVIPKHVLKGFVDGLIATKETCPVTMEDLALGNIGLTGCYHAFERSAIQHIMATTRICPTCRSGLHENIIML